MKSRLAQDAYISTKERIEIGKMFNCSHGAITADIFSLSRTSATTVFPNERQKQIIRKRDGNICQYCGSSQSPAYIVEHVIPASKGGHARPYNLVMACDSCNSKKKGCTWIPANIDTITKDHPQWKEKILQEYQKNPRKTGPVPRLNQPIKYSTQLTEQHREMLEQYCAKHKIHAAQAIRDAIELLVSQDRK